MAKGTSSTKKTIPKTASNDHHSFRSFLTTTPHPSSLLSRQAGKPKARTNKVHFVPIAIGDIVILAGYSWYIHSTLRAEASPPQSSSLASWAEDEKNADAIGNLHLLGSYGRIAKDGGPLASNPQYQNRADCLYPFYVYLINLDDDAKSELDTDKEVFFANHPLLQALTDAVRLGPINTQWTPGTFIYSNNPNTTFSDPPNLTDFLMEPDLYDLFHTITNMTKTEVKKQVTDDPDFKQMVCLFFNYTEYFEEPFCHGLDTFYPF
jgi:hypothetical protein